MIKKNYKIIKIGESRPASLKDELDSIITDSWGSHGDEYMEEHLMSAHILYVASLENEKVALAACQRYFFKNKPIYYLAFTAVKKGHQGHGLQAKLNIRIFAQIFFESLIRGKLNVEVMNISPNPRVLGSVLRTAHYTFPDPKLPLKAPDYVWERVKFLVTTIGDPIDKLNRNGCVNTGFYDDPRYSHLVYNEKNIPKDKDPVVNEFAMKILTPEKGVGREMVIYSRYSVFDLIKFLAKKAVGVEK